MMIIIVSITTLTLLSCPGGRGRRWERRSASAALPAAASPPQAPWKVLLKSLKEDLGVRACRCSKEALGTVSKLCWVGNPWARGTLLKLQLYKLQLALCYT